MYHFLVMKIKHLPCLKKKPYLKDTAFFIFIDGKAFVFFYFYHIDNCLWIKQNEKSI